MLKIYNSLTGRKEPFEPIESGHVRMYVCGITVYDHIHLGHGRMLIVFDVVARYLRALGYELTYVRNITDIEDKIIQRAAQNGESVDELTARYIASMNADCAALGLLSPTFEPRATEYIESIIDMIRALVERGYAYQGENGDVYYAVKKFAGYGRLSGKRLEDLRSGARVEVTESKHDPLDFVLWKAAKPGEPVWDSPWGAGRPGWHIECSAMSTAILGDTFDIHGGGMDLKFPHHENEIAQSRGASGQPFVKLWMHNGFVRVDEEKMSKSLGNFFTVREVLKEFQAEVVRYLMLGSHYRSPLNYTDENLRQAKAALDRLYLALRSIRSDVDTPIDTGHQARFESAMNDDFNTPEAVAVLQSLAGEINRSARRNAPRAATMAATLRRLGGVLGLLQLDPEDHLKGRAGTGGDGRDSATGDAAGGTGGFSDAVIDAMIERRRIAKSERNWLEADRIRDELKAHGVILEDSPRGTTWRRE